MRVTPGVSDEPVAAIDPLRIRDANDAAPRPHGDYVLYWMIAARRASWNFALDRALGWACELAKPLVVLEALRCDYPWASDRIHRFVLDGMQDNLRAFEATPALYYPYVEPTPGAGDGLLEALAARACIVVTDEFPCFFLPRMVRAVAARLPVRLEVVDSNGLLPLRASERAFDTAYAFRRHLQKTLLPHLSELPTEKPFARGKLPARASLPPEIAQRWPAASPALLEHSGPALAALPIDHSTAPVARRGGPAAARAALRAFVNERLVDYAQRRSEPGADASSGLSPFLHFGHLSAHELFVRVAEHEDWSPLRVAAKATGSKSGWWGARAPAESFLDEAITWRELGYNCCWFREDYDRYESLPAWARATLDKHARDPRPYLYSLDELAAAGTHDALWNAAQTQLQREGRIHNYLRMLWGKKILEWSADPRAALAAMIELNNRLAIDGRNPNSYSGIFWTLGRYDRPWPPERAIFGNVRYMSSQNTARKFELDEYLRRYGAGGTQGKRSARLFV